MRKGIYDKICNDIIEKYSVNEIYIMRKHVMKIASFILRRYRSGDFGQINLDELLQDDRYIDLIFKLDPDKILSEREKRKVIKKLKQEFINTINIDLIDPRIPMIKKIMTEKIL